MSILESKHDEALIDLEFDDVVATIAMSPAVTVETDATHDVVPAQRHGLVARIVAHLRAQAHAAQLASLLATQPSLRHEYLYALSRDDAA